MDEHEEVELLATTEAVLVVLRTFFAELPPRDALRRKLRAALMENEVGQGAQSPHPDWLKGLRIARAKMGL